MSRSTPGGRRRGCSPVQATGTNISRIQDLAGANLTAQVTAAPAGNTVSFTTATYSVSDFGAGVFNGVTVGAAFQRQGLIGTGIGNTLIQMTASTSTKSASVPAAGSGLTNQLYLFYTDTDGCVWRCLNFKGNSQGHLFNGIRWHGVAGGSARNIRCIGVAPGNDFVPPGETFAWNDYQGSGNVYENVEIDGRTDGATGTGTGAAAFGANSYVAATYIDCYAHDTPFSGGWAVWQGTGVTNLVRCRAHLCRTAVNIERVGREAIGQARGTVNLINFNFGTATSQDIFLGNDQGSTLLNIYDPIGRSSAFQNKIRIWYPTLEQGNTNIQSQSDVKVWTGGAWTGSAPGVGTYVGGTDVTSTYIDYNPFE